MSWSQDVSTILRQEPELWLDYLTGKRLTGDLPRPQKRPAHLPTFLLKSFWFFIWAATKWSPSTNKKRLTQGEGIDFLVLATSRNQINTTSSLMTSLVTLGQSVVGISKGKRLKSVEDQRLYQPITYGAMDIWRALLAYRAHGHALYRAMKDANNNFADQKFLEVAKVYLYLAYFYRTLNQCQPRAVVTSNDHSALNRCLLAVAHLLDIKTVYIQHASVSPYFPALLFDYAFLDGPAAAEIYADCADNRPESFNRALTSNITFSGQQKSLTTKPPSASKVTGIAINKLDNIASVLRLIRELADDGIAVRARWHPRQSKGDIRKLESESQKLASLALSDPERESVDEFLNHVTWLVAGNSSIHLEGAIKGIAPLYYEFSASPHPDYYGFVEKGVATWVKSEDDLIALLKSGRIPELNEEAVRFYSSTFGTEWEGRESELVARHLASELAKSRTP